MPKTFILALFLLLIMGLFSCQNRMEVNKIESIFKSASDSMFQSSIRYAKGFDLYEIQGVKKLVIYHPELADYVVATYYIVDSSVMRKHGFQPSGNTIVLPLANVAVFSATQLNAFERLGLLDQVKGVSEARYIKSEAVRKKLDNGEIVELATTSDYFIEKILSVNPSVIFYSPYKFTEQHPLENTGKHLVPFYDYFENEPLGRAEWIKFTATFFGADDFAAELFREMESNYLKYRNLTKNLVDKPTVFSDKYFNGQWYVPGGKSYIAALFMDAGVDYIWKDDSHTGSFPLDYEVVYSKAHNTDYWRIVGSYGDESTYEALAEENELYTNFKAFKDKHVIWCNAEATAYFEKSPLEPQWLLADMIFAFHPELLPDYTPKYYQILK